MTVGGPGSRVEERELVCIQFSRTVYGQQTAIVMFASRRPVQSYNASRHFTHPCTVQTCHCASDKTAPV